MLCCAVLCCAVLSCAVLCCPVLSCAVLCCAVLRLRLPLHTPPHPHPHPPSPIQSIQSPPPQANNVYIFPALGQAAVATRGQRLTDEMFVVAAEELAGMTSLDDVEAGR